MYSICRYCDTFVQDVLLDDNIKLDQNFKMSFIGEIIKVCEVIETVSCSNNVSVNRCLCVCLAYSPGPSRRHSAIKHSLM